MVAGDPKILHICDMIKGNESDVANIVFEILAKEVVKLICFIVLTSDILFITLCNQMSNFDGAWIKLWHYIKLAEYDVKNSLKMLDM